MNPEPVRVLVTGGTFDKEYNELNGSLFFKDTHLPEMLRLGRSRIDVSISTLMMIDSLEMTAADRAPHRRRVRAGGRDADPDHARHRHDGRDRRGARGGARRAGKTIVLTGAMIPYAFGSSDGLFNLGSALSFVQALPAGVYIAMNGRCFDWDRVRKNRETGSIRGHMTSCINTKDTKDTKEISGIVFSLCPSCPLC